jgi:hypothetical protein
VVRYAERGHVEDLDPDKRLILKYVFKKCYGGYELDRSGSGKGHVPGGCECGYEPLGSIICGEFLDRLKTG